MTWHSKTQRAFQRELPGGGFVAIDVNPSLTLFGRHWVGRVIVERRAELERQSKAAPVIARASAKSIEAVLQRLLPTALCNLSIGAGLLHHGMCECPSPRASAR